ncbi:hypothetical protein [Leeuwenhoekiella parthenopeia]|uniref:Uncharacterized protein n=1 Tax=Leeuwenhoekiella parthenopeia TaxID=2890320 RepID=A0ABS8GS95_9FLAO|nr:hypothetical protein [Leeuwenhoekiella parthenopeia]MCC4212651.1 hypothetical protein [Leeuwenhoekiella parthenopeia]
MKTPKIFFWTLFLIALNFKLSAQVGINTTTPAAALDVNGSSKTDERLFLENPGNSTVIRGSKLIIEKTDRSIVQYDINISKYGPINYAEFVFRNSPRAGIADYDTKISTADYTVSVQGYYFRENGSNSTNVHVVSNKGNSVVEGFQVYAYKNTGTNTWFIKCLVNDGIFEGRNTNANIDIYMNLIIYRKRFIAKEVNSYYINMNRIEVGTLGKPPGF